eukprot:4332907-Amphidinium_carterae.1
MEYYGVSGSSCFLRAEVSNHTGSHAGRRPKPRKATTSKRTSRVGVLIICLPTSVVPCSVLHSLRQDHVCKFFLIGFCPQHEELFHRCS